MNEQQDTPIETDQDTASFDTATDVAVNTIEPDGNPHVDALARDIGPRAPGSEAESEAADYLVSALGRVGLPAARLASRTARIESLPEMGFALAALVALAVAILLPALGLVLILALLGLMLADLLGYLQLSKWIPTKESVNVLTIVPPGETEIRRLIVTATLDTGQVGLLSRRHWAFGYAWMHVIILLSMLLGLVIVIVDLVRDAGVSRLLYVVPALVLAGCLALLAERALSSRYSPGAITNASGVAALIDIAASAVARPPEWLEIWFLGIGGSSASGGGIIDFLEKNTFDPDITYFVHLQSPGGGDPVVPRAAGAGLRSAPATPLLTWIFDSVRGESTGIQAEKTPTRLPVGTQAHATHRAGYQSAVIVGVDERGRIPFLDDGGDVPYQVNTDSIEKTVHLVQAGIDALDREVAARAMLARSTASIQNVEEPSTTNEDLPTDEE